MSSVEELQEQLRLANAQFEERIEQERQRADEQQQLFEQERQRADEQQKRADEGEQLVEQERQRADEQKQLVEQERQRADEKDKSLRKTTLSEYLDLCHTHLFQSISVQTNKALTTQGGITNPKGKLCPNNLRPWDDFLRIQQTTHQRLKLAYQSSDERIFESSHFIEVLGQRVASHSISSEAHLAVLQKETIEVPVTAIIQHLQSIDSIRNEFNVNSGIQFDNHPNGLSDTGEEVAQRIRSSPPSTPHRSIPPLSGLRADQICVYTHENGDPALRKLAFVVEYKAPHKLSLASLRFGLREMDIKSIINAPCIPTAKIMDKNQQEIDNPEHFKYHADLLVASVIAQTFSYMIQGGVQYGYITTGEAFVFLHIQAEDPGTLYYHLIEPKNDVTVEKDAEQEFVNRTAVSQVLAFSLLAMESEPTRQTWRGDAIDLLDTWEVDYEAVLRAIPESVRKDPPQSTYRGKAYLPVDQFKMVLRKKKRSQSTCRAPSTPLNKTDPDLSDDTENEHHDTPTRGKAQPTNNKRRPQNRGNRSKNANVPQHGAQRRPFCTQLCLKRLAEGGRLDMFCPNVSGHRVKGLKSNQHQLDRQSFLALLHQQLKRNRDDDCYPMGVQGARGALFKITLTSHGYTVAAKGTVAAFVKDLEHERQVYRRLWRMQGILVPVCLGSIDLAHPYYYDIGVQIVHMMILSWAGERLDGNMVLKHVDQKRLDTLVKQSIEEVHHAGILHGDLRIPNILWNTEIDGIMLIDFERSKFITDFRRTLTQISPNREKKRRILVEQALDKKAQKSSSDSKSQVEIKFMNEMSSAQGEVASFLKQLIIKDE
ncbi:hypothetical protein EAF04_000706 [Stromatinia cepivora]|nr:hypothetical protein EAF04_000706 [Stromatinia cepivora]